VSPRFYGVKIEFKNVIKIKIEMLKGKNNRKMENYFADYQRDVILFQENAKPIPTFCPLFASI